MSIADLMSNEGLDEELANNFFDDDFPEPRKVRVKEAVRWKSLDTRSVEEVPRSATDIFLLFLGVFTTIISSG